MWGLNQHIVQPQSSPSHPSPSVKKKDGSIHHPSLSLFFSLERDSDEESTGDSLKKTSNNEITKRRLSRNKSLKIAATGLKCQMRLTANAKIVDDLFSTGNQLSVSSNVRPLTDLSLVGVGYVGQFAEPKRSIANQSSKVKPIRCLFLSTPNKSDNIILKYLRERYPNHRNDSLDVPSQLSQKLPKDDGENDIDIAPFSTSAVPLPIPLSREESKEFKLLSFAFRGRYISKSVLLPLASILTNRDGCLWDNLPWTEWTIDPQLRNRNSSGKGIPKKYLLGKRDAYNRMIGRDWYGRSLSAGNTAARLKYVIDDYFDERTESRNNERDSNDNDSTSDTTFVVESNLALRILQIQNQEATMALAEAEQKYAILKSSLGYFESDQVIIENLDNIQSHVNKVEEALARKNTVEDALEAFLQRSSSDEPQVRTELEEVVNEFLVGVMNNQFFKEKDIDAAAWEDAELTLRKFLNGIRQQSNLMDDLNTILDRESFNIEKGLKKSVSDFLESIIEKETKNAPPYRGAMAYSPQVDTKEEMFYKNLLPYRSPYDLLVEIIQEQCNAEVVGTILENSSLFPGTLVLEGAVVIRRRGLKKSMNIGGEEIEIEDSEEVFGNDGVFIGDALVIECAGDEAIGMAIACDLPVSIEQKVWQEVSIDVALAKVEPLGVNDLESVLNSIPPVQPIDSTRSIVTEGGEALIQGKNNKKFTSDTNESEALEIVEEKVITINSLNDYEALTVPDKARFVLRSSKFEGQLPRPRVLRRFEEKMNAFKKVEYSSGIKTEEMVTMFPTTLSPLDEIAVSMIENELVQLEIRMKDAVLRRDQESIDIIQRKMNKIQGIEQ